MLAAWSIISISLCTGRRLIGISVAIIPSTGTGRAVSMGSSLPDRQHRLAKIDDQTYDVTAADGSRKVRFTLNRDVATSQDGIELLGLDHPLVQEELGSGPIKLLARRLIG